MTLLQTVLFEMRRWERARGQACGLIRVSPELMAGIKLEATVWPIGARGGDYLERVPGIPADWLVDPRVEGHVCAFESLQAEMSIV